MFTIKIMNEFLHSPIWSYEEGIISYEPPIIEYDMELQELCNKVEDMYSSYYEFDTHDQACWFNYEKEKEEKDVMLDLITSIIARLNQINDGSFIIEDLETERLKNL